LKGIRRYLYWLLIAQAPAVVIFSPNYYPPDVIEHILLMSSITVGLVSASSLVIKSRVKIERAFAGIFSVLYGLVVLVAFYVNLSEVIS
jgi:hypothetical protein